MEAKCHTKKVMIKAHVDAEVATSPGSRKPERTFTKNLSFCAHCNGSNVARVDVKNGRIIRIRPLHYDEKYERREFNPWQMNARGKVFHPTMKEPVSPFALSYKKRIYSPNRIMYPLQRVDWDPDGERNPGNRGISKFKRISWDEATDKIASEIKRIQEKYGTSAILLKMGNHGETKCVHGPHGIPAPAFKGRLHGAAL